MEAKSNLYSRTEVTMFVLAEHLNHMDNMHGGEIMKLMDNTAGHVWMRHAGGDAVTAAVEQLRFIQGIPAKSFIRCIAQIVSVGQSSMKVKVEVHIENLKDGTLTLAAEGIFIGVAIDEEGNSRPVAPIIIEE